eukprot:2474149-Pleurochrysis_carterae.AAC.1
MNLLIRRIRHATLIPKAYIILLRGAIYYITLHYIDVGCGCQSPGRAAGTERKRTCIVARPSFGEPSATFCGVKH